MTHEPVIAIVTGASRGLGKSLVHALSKEGVTVAACSLNGADERDIAAVDVTDPKAVDAFVASVIDLHGKIDMLVNNAGWTGAMKPLEETTDEEFARCMDTNVKGIFHMMRAVLPHMKKMNGGMIMNISSRAGHKAHPLLGVYSASKHAVLGLTQAVAKQLQEEGSAVRCMSVSPGGINTDMRRELFGKEDSDNQQDPDAVSALLMHILLGKTTVPQGADVEVVRGNVTVREMA